MKVSIVCLDRPQARGETRRIEAWCEILQAAGHGFRVHRLIATHSVPRHRLSSAQLAAIARGEAVPESVAWSLPSLEEALGFDEPVICLTARAFHPALTRRRAPVILDFVDDLASSYRQRASVSVSPLRSLGLRVLSSHHARFQTKTRGGIHVVAAGWSDAQHLGATWVPNVLIPQRAPTSSPDVDLVFFGSLSYAPNIAAVEALGDMWPALQRLRPGTTALIAGSRPTAAIGRLASTCGWLLETDYATVADVATRGRVAVTPVVHSAGIQNKVLEAAALGTAQVISPEVMRGLDPAFPIKVATVGPDFVDRVVELLADPVGRVVAGEVARRHVAEMYAPATWVPTIAAMLDRGTGTSPDPTP